MFKKRFLKYSSAGLFFMTSVILLIIGTNSCKTHNDKYLEEGIIEYETSVVDNSHPLADLAPTSATLKFKKDRFYVELSVMGMFNTMIVCDVPKKEVTQMVKFMNVKQACIAEEFEISEENANYRVHLEETTETKMIAGYECIKVNAYMEDYPKETFEVYYTKDLGVENCNALSPYKQLKGMLMQYRLKKMGLELNFVAKSVRKTPVSDHLFELPGYYRIVTSKEMREFFDSLQ